MNHLPNPNPSPPLPRIACFHGGGSNSLVFASQCKRLQHLLADEYEFVFFDAPFEREAGPGVLPYFKELAPFRTWMRPEFLDDDESEVLQRVIQLLADDTAKRQRMKGADMQVGEGNGERERPVGKWIGAMGFSQGTRVVGGLLRWMESVQHSDARSSYPDIDIQFGVLCMGSAKPMSYSTRSSSRSSYIPSLSLSLPCHLPTTG
jgi:predicted esterase